MEQASQREQPAQVRINRHYPVAPEKVWQAWTEARALSQWFSPAGADSRLSADIDLREGGRWRISFHAPDGERSEVSGVYQEVLPHRRLVFSWAWKSTPDRVSRISITLVPEAGGTRMEFVHDRFFDDEARRKHEAGWQVFFGHLDRLFSSNSQEA